VHDVKRRGAPVLRASKQLCSQPSTDTSAYAFFCCLKFSLASVRLRYPSNILRHRNRTSLYCLAGRVNAARETGVDTGPLACFVFSTPRRCCTGVNVVHASIHTPAVNLSRFGGVRAARILWTKPHAPYPSCSNALNIDTGSACACTRFLPSPLPNLRARYAHHATPLPLPCQRHRSHFQPYGWDARLDGTSYLRITMNHA